jgi:hypothetical protein
MPGEDLVERPKEQERWATGDTGEILIFIFAVYSCHVVFAGDQKKKK